MGEVVGIPRALLYYHYYPMWKVFFESLGASVVTSGETTRAVLDAGARVAVDEACLPIKVFHGHVLALAGNCDYVFVPRLVSVERRAFICPKFMGLPDMVRCNCPGIPNLIDSCVNLSKSTRGYVRAVYSAGRVFTGNTLRILAAHTKAKAALATYTRYLESGMTPDEALALMGMTNSRDASARGGVAAASSPLGAARNPGKGQDGVAIGLVGHPYVVYDPFVSMGVIRRLREMGAIVVTSDMVPASTIESEASRFPRRVFWTLGRRLLGAGFYFLGSGAVHGCLHMRAFACGPESLIGEILEREAARHRDVPFATITVDEHTGEAGVLTRLEAFFDVVTRRKKR
ncbi:MAG: acyl-CoA dehydratase activase-related protein [Firmicutes bacterium]|nr:acyl-CoA dehydratase activase-related protein [Bacillota bacterium]MDH7495539.1 acyl-CoA dehydratase activase-related protein [Bacillota bacterium]